MIFLTILSFQAILRNKKNHQPEYKEECTPMKLSHLGICIFILSVSPFCWGQETSVVINELMYHPASDDNDEEYLELYNNGETLVDLSGWYFSDGIDYQFPEGTFLPAHSFLIVCSSPEIFAQTYQAVTTPVYGPYPNRLSNSGERVELRNAIGTIIDALTYDDHSPWPEPADGDEPSLELRNPSLDNSQAENWAAGIAGGTPGATNSVYEASSPPFIRVLQHHPPVPAPTESVSITVEIQSEHQISEASIFYSTSILQGTIPQGDSWNYFRGTGEPTGALYDWTQREYDDAEWETGPTGIGFGDHDDATILEDMQGNYLSVYLRKTFSIPHLDRVQYMALNLDWDDGYVLYLNGTEINRVNLGTQGEFIPYNRGADSEHYSTADIPDLSPLILNLSSHIPLLQEGENVLAIQCHNLSLDDDDFSIIPSLKWYSRSPFIQEPLSDDGEHQDGTAGDGIYGAFIPPCPQDTLVEFYSVARDTGGIEATAPQQATASNCLYQVDGRFYSNALSLYRVILDREDSIKLLARRPTSDVLLNCTFISGNSIYYRRGIRLRGSTARYMENKSYRIEFSLENPLDGIMRLNLNGYHVPQQFFAWDFIERTGLPHADFQLVHLIFDNIFYPNYLQVERMDEDFLYRQFPGDDEGPFYRGIDNATLEYLGPEPDAYRDSYEKITHEQEDDYFDIIDLADRFTNSTDEEFPSRIAEKIDVDQWMDYFAMQTMLGNIEGGIYRKTGDDYFLYHRPSDDRFLILPWDTDGAFSATAETVFIHQVPSIVRLIQHPEFVRSYYKALDRYLQGPFTLRAMRRSLDSYRDSVPSEAIQAIEEFVIQRRQSIMEEVPQRLVYLEADASGSPECRRYAFDNPTVKIMGESNAAQTVAVKVNSEFADWDPRGATWEADLVLEPGMNEIRVEAIGEDGKVFDSLLLPLYYYDQVQTLPSTLPGNMVLTESGSPYYIGDTVRVPTGTTLQIEPGTTLFLDSGAALWVEGTLEALGTADRKIYFLPWNCEPWGAIGAIFPETPVKLSHCEFRMASRKDLDELSFVAAVTLAGATGELDFCNFFNCENCVEVIRSSLTYRNGIMDTISEGIHSWISHCVIEDSTFRNIITKADAVDFDRDTDQVSVVRRCFFDGGKVDDGIDTLNTNVVIENNIFTGYDADNGKAISLQGDSVPLIRYNLIYGNDVGIAIRDSCAPILDHNTIVDNTIGIDSYEKVSGKGPGLGILTNSIVWDNNHQIRFDYFSQPGVTSTLETRYSNVQADSPIPGEGNINLDPAFINPQIRDYHLQPDSPCKGTGEGGTDMGAFLLSQSTATPTPTMTATPSVTPTSTPTLTPTETPLPLSPRWKLLMGFSIEWHLTVNETDLLILFQEWDE